MRRQRTKNDVERQLIQCCVYLNAEQAVVQDEPDRVRKANIQHADQREGP